MGSKTPGRRTPAPRRRTAGWTTVAIRELEAGIAFALKYDLNVLISGENVVGRTSVAHRIHREGRRASAALVVAGLPGALDSPETLQGALLEASPGGAVLLETPELMSPLLQSQLLRFIESAASARYNARLPARGGHVRFITATGIDLFELVRLHQFHPALFYRLNTIHLLTSPLRNRVESVSVLSDHVLFDDTCSPGVRASRATRQSLAPYSWPGNLGELRDVAKSLGLLERSVDLELKNLPPRIRR